MKRIALGFSILLTAGLFVLMACNKKNNTVPEQDTEVQSAVLASYMNYVATDVDMMISFMGENSYLKHFYMEYPNSHLPDGTGTVTAIRGDTSGSAKQGYLRMSFNKTRCADGRSRDGSVFLNYTVGDNDPNAKYMHSPGFSGSVKFSAFRIDSFDVNVDTSDGGYLKIRNTLPSGVYDPKKTNLTWSIDGKLKFTHIYDPRKNMTWEGHLTKILANTSSTAVVVTTTTSINWFNAVIQYKGTVMGKVPVASENGALTPTAFNMNINNVYPLVRDFKCTPDPIGGVTYTAGNNANTGTMVAIPNQHHPFVSGVASFTIGDQYPREIYYGNEGHASFTQGAEATLPVTQCDNTGEVLIKGVAYRVDFMK
ncbi:MAG: hypothetical protein JNL60_17020 [Bacteroidia bacterium]|nr:hypothetical protein [Bacteroidia bacterium]